MKKVRFGLLTKIILLTGMLTILTVATSLTANLFISHKVTRDSYIESCEYVTDKIESVYFSATTEENALSVLNMFIEKYSYVRDTYDEIDQADVDAYQDDLRLSLFGAKDGAIGVSRDQIIRKDYYVQCLSNMQSLCADNKVNDATFILFDVEKQRALIVSNNSLSLDENLNNIGYEDANVSDKEMEFFLNSTLESDFTTFVTADAVQSCNLIDVVLQNTNYKCFIRGFYLLTEFNKAFNNQLITELIITVASAAFLVVVYAILTKVFLINNVDKLTKSTNKFVGMMKNDEALGIVDSNIKTTDEIRELSDAFTVMQNQIITYVDNIKKAKDKEQAFNAEVNVASKIQLESLPAATHFNRNLELRALISPAKAVGGDFYDYFYIDKDHLAMVIADVSGKGIPASLFMMRSKESIRSTSLNESDLSKVFFKVNNSLCINNKEGFFVTAFLGILDLKSYDFSYISAGHERPFIKRGNECKRLDVESNFVLGLEEDFVYQKQSIKLQEGDTIILYTDGLNEAINPNKEEFGYERIADSLKKSDILKQNISNLIIDLEEFKGQEEQFDDITLLSFNIKKNTVVYSYLKPKYEDIDDLTDKVNEYLDGLDPIIVSKIGVVIDEVLNNIISYGKTKTNKTLSVTIEKTTDGATLIFIDNSHPFNPLLKEDRTVQENMNEGIVGGLGISIIRNISKETEYVYSDNKNILIVKF